MTTTRPAADPADGLRVAFVAGPAVGGIATHVRGLVSACRAAGHQVRVLAPVATLAVVAADHGDSPGPGRDGGCGCERGADGRDVRGPGRGGAALPVPIGNRPHPVHDARAMTAIRSVARSWRADIIHAHGIKAGALAGLALSTVPRGNRPALIVTLHNAPPAGRFAGLAFAVLERACARRADLILCASADLVDRMRALGARAAEPVPVAAAMSAAPAPAEVSRARADFDAGPRPVVLAVARLAPQKGLDVLIDAATRWRDRRPQPRTVIAGDGPLAGELRRQAAAAGADVLLLGWRTDVAALLAAADIVVVPSRWEARSLVLQEAMRAGCTVVATRAGGTPELTGADAAVLIPPGDPAALADAVIAVLDDPSLAARLRLAARARSGAFPSEHDAAQQTLALYRRIAGTRTVRTSITKLA